MHELQNRALLEGWASGMWARYSGVLLWKMANPWAGLRGQLYDWRLAQTGGFYGARAACEPLHVQLNLRTLQARRCDPLCRSPDLGDCTCSVWEGGAVALCCFISLQKCTCRLQRGMHRVHQL